ncbi:hypothetical protein [Saccharospirillum mangrovi]|uniref:hypothetical protein n=1 Tax=Saccharospirillum mangrovi TaxID=2161747 RepID=UPI000D3B8EB1|nr:hypothetical protein [Saccharospirillum mangrovi]
MKQWLGLISLLFWALSTHAADTSFSVAGTTPVTQFDRIGVRAYVQTDIGQHLTLGAGYAQVEPQLGVSQGSVITRLSFPFQTSLNERFYPFMGIDQQVDADAIEPALFFGIGVEQQWIDQWGGFLETRYQTRREEDWHLQVGIRFWPGRAKRLDVRMRNSDPDTAEEGEFNGRIELSDVSEQQAQAQQPEPEQQLEPDSEPQAEPEPRAVPESEPEPQVAESAPEPLPPPEPEVQQVLSNLMDQAKRDLPDGVYVHLGFFRQVHSIQRYRNLVTDFVWADELLVHYDERLNGYRIVIGPYTLADARARAQAVRDGGLDAFIYMVPENPAYR